MPSIGVVGAGAGGVATASVVDRALEGSDVTVLEKSGGVCGRAATRRHGDLTYDYGANYVKDDDPRVVELLTETLPTDGLVDVDEPIYTFDGRGRVSEGRDADDHKWTYRRGLTQVAKRLLAETDAEVHRDTRVRGLARNSDDGTWTATDDEGHEWGPFDALVLNPPAPQTADLLVDADWSDPLREELVAAARDVDYRSVWTAVLHYEFPIERPYYALINTDDDHEVGWIAREECKPGHVPDGETLLIVQAAPDWSREYYDRDPGRNVDRLAELTADVLDDARLADPDWSDHQGWRYALPESGVGGGIVDSVADCDLYPVGDWVAGEGRVHAALRNGLDTGERIVHALENDR